MHDFDRFAEGERAGWSDASVVDGYTTHLEPITDEVATTIAARLDGAGRSALDLCCGRGHLAASLRESGAEVTALDFSPEMLARARGIAPGARLVEGDAASLPFADAEFDAVGCNFGIPHLPDPSAALAEVRRVLKPGGTFVASTWCGPDTSPAFGAILGAIRAHADLTRLPEQPDFFALSRPDTAREMLANAELTLTRHDVLTPVLQLEAARDLFELFANATVGIRMLIRSQEPSAVAAIRDHAAATVEETCRHERGYRVPMPATVVIASTV